MRAKPHRAQPDWSQALLCLEGEHELCGEWLAGATIEGAFALGKLGHPPVEHRRCGCGCHIEPWPFEHAEEETRPQAGIEIPNPQVSADVRVEEHIAAAVAAAGVAVTSIPPASGPRRGRARPAG